MAQTVAQFESKSKPGTFHSVVIGADGNMYCTCPAWRFQKGQPTDGRHCKHTRSVMRHSRV